MTLAMALVASLAFLSSGCAVLLASRMAKTSREMAASTVGVLTTQQQVNRELFQAMVDQLQASAQGSQEMARSVTADTMAAALKMVQSVSSTIYPVASGKQPIDSEAEEALRRLAQGEGDRPAWEDLQFGAELREDEESLDERGRLSRTWPMGSTPAGMGGPMPPEAPAGWSDRPAAPPVYDQDEDPVAAAERYHREKYFDPSPP